MRDYTLQMKIVGYLHSVYPDVPISLHAGELAYGMVPPDGLRFHIRQAVEIGDAERIGHGVDLMYEDKPQELLKELAQKHVMIEINLTRTKESWASRARAPLSLRTSPPSSHRALN